MTSRKQRLDVGSSSSNSHPDSNKPRKRRFDDVGENDPFAEAAKAKEMSNNTSEKNPNVNPYTNQEFSRQYHDLFNKRRALPVWEYKEAFMATLSKNQVGSSKIICRKRFIYKLNQRLFVLFCFR